MADDGIKRVTIRFSYAKKEHHRKAYEVMESKANSSKNEYIIQAILEKEEGLESAEVIKKAVRAELTGKHLQMNMAGFDELLRKIIREELKCVSYVPEGSIQTKKEIEQSDEKSTVITPAAMDFLSTL